MGAIPHRASDPGLLIVARWPAPTGRDERVEAEVDAVLELVRGLRNARAEARVEATAWLPTEVVVPMSMGPTFEALRPAVERLARARPLERRLSREALGQGSGPVDALTVIAGELEALAHPGGEYATARPWPRNEPGSSGSSPRRAAGSPARARLANEAFIARAPPDGRGGTSAGAELADQVERLEDRLPDV